MKKTWKNIIKSVVFVLLLCLILGEVNRVLMIKAVEYRRYSSYSQYKNFYEMDRDTIDVLFAGSSHSYCSFSPQDFYNQYGIRSFNLGSSRQDVLLSYYWLKEALRYQKPKAVVLETFYIFRDGGEPFARRALDYMKWSDVKREAIDAAHDKYPEITPKSFYLPNIRFHERWKEVGEDDFYYRSLAESYELKGYSAIGVKYGKEDYQPFSLNTEEKTEISENARQYLDKIVELCRDNQIGLVFISNPALDWSVQEHNAVSEYTKQQGIAYYDFNTKELYEDLGYHFSEDNGDAGHSNIWGTEKITKAVGKILQQSFQVEDREDEQWERSKPYYENIRKDYSLKDETEINQYLPLLSDARYTVFISAKGKAVKGLTEEVKSNLKDLGLQTEFTGKGNDSYYAVISPEGVQEKIGGSKLYQEGSLRGGLSSYNISSGGQKSGDISSVVIDKKEYSPNERGLNLVIYNHESNEVIDAVCFDVIKENKAVRK